MSISCESLELFGKEVMPEFQHDPEHDAWKKGVLDGSIQARGDLDTQAFSDRYGKLAVNVGSVRCRGLINQCATTSRSP